jgi:hypothetical protein
MYSPNQKEYANYYFNGGMNVTKPETEILDSQAASCQNVINNQLIGIDSRYGYVAYYSTAVNSTQIKSLALYNTYGSSIFMAATASGIYADLYSSAVQVWSALASSKVRSFEMNGNIYFLDGSQYIQYTLDVI